MARPRVNFTLSTNTVNFLKEYKNKSKTIDDAIEYFKNKDKHEAIMPKKKIEVIIKRLD